MSSAQEVQRERERQRQHKEKIHREEKALRQAFNGQGELREGWMEQVLDTDDLEDKLQRNTITKIQGLLNKQWILSNLTDAEAHDRVYWLEGMKYKILGEHPPEGSLVSGEVRAFLFDDPHEELRPLTPQERNQIDQIIKALQTMVTRSREGFERRQINTNIARTETQQEKDNDSGGFTSLFES